jgi:CRISPR/Cas system-associated protein endoribonuclease Cas2
MAISEARIQIARLIDELYMKGICLFDLPTMSRIEVWLVKHARKKLYEKVQTLFQMGKRKELLELLDWMEATIPKIRQLANDPDVLLTASGKPFNESVARKFWLDRPIPDEVRKFIESKVDG